MMMKKRWGLLLSSAVLTSTIIPSYAADFTDSVKIVSVTPNYV